MCTHRRSQKDGKLLMQRRKNTGFGDGMLSLVSGHVDEFEGLQHAMAREAAEEVGIRVTERDLRIACTVYRPSVSSRRVYWDVYLQPSTWEGEPRVCEPEVCGGLEYHSLDELPHDTMPHVAEVLRRWRAGETVMELGWDEYRKSAGAADESSLARA
jgi:8-oxo-dGTP pyrophosphatase MutT (NUDIX family)